MDQVRAAAKASACKAFLPGAITPESDPALLMYAADWAIRWTEFGCELPQ